MKRILFAALLLASCSKGGPPDIRISDAWARETIAGQTATAAYMALKNEGGDDRLTGISAQPPAMAMLHESESSDGISRMRPMRSGLAIPAGATIELKPGGDHIMITGLTAPLRAGATIELTVRFEKSGVRKLDVPVAPALAPGAN